MLSLTNKVAQQLLNSNQEHTAQSLKLRREGAPVELYIGVGQSAYMEAADAERYLLPWEHQAGLNPVYRHLTADGLKDMLRRGRFVITTDED